MEQEMLEEGHEMYIQSLVDVLWEIAQNDVQNSRGLFADIGGIYRAYEEVMFPTDDSITEDDVKRAKEVSTYHSRDALLDTIEANEGDTIPSAFESDVGEYDEPEPDDSVPTSKTIEELELVRERLHGIEDRDGVRNHAAGEYVEQAREKIVCAMTDLKREMASRVDE